MAQEALQKVGWNGVGIKVETNGASGVGNKLTAEILKMLRLLLLCWQGSRDGSFDSKPLIKRPVADGIRKTEELINLALSGKLKYTRSLMVEQ